MDLNGLSEEEFEQVAQVIKRDAELRRREEIRMSQIQSELDVQSSQCAKTRRETTQDTLLLEPQSKDISLTSTSTSHQQQQEQEHPKSKSSHCNICCTSFNFIFTKKIICHSCLSSICRNCCSYANSLWTCRTCYKKRYLQAYLSLYCPPGAHGVLIGDPNANTIRFGNAKLNGKAIGDTNNIINNIICNAKSSDLTSNCVLEDKTNSLSEEDLIMNRKCNSQSSQVTNHESIANHEDDYAIIEAREQVEIVVEGMLGGCIDNVHVDNKYSDLNYDQLTDKYKDKLSLALLDLTRALYFVTNKNPDDSSCLTPTSAHIALKQVIYSIKNEVSVLPLLSMNVLNDPSSSNHSSSLSTSLTFDSYEELLAMAIINKLVGDNQREIINQTEEDLSMFNGLDGSVMNDNYYDSKSRLSQISSNVIVGSSDESDVNLRDREREAEFCLNKYESHVKPEQEDDCIVRLEERIEEMTTTSFGGKEAQEEMQEEDEGNMTDASFDYLPAIGLLSDHEELLPLKVFYPEGLQVAFPEAGIDLIDRTDDESGVSQQHIQSCKTHFSNLCSWQENWLFQGKKHLKDLPQNIPFLAFSNLDMIDASIPMLIPNPSERLIPKVGEMEVDQVSDLSEHNSVGSLEFSEDDEENDSDAHVSFDDFQETLKENIIYESFNQVKSLNSSSRRSTSVNVSKRKKEQPMKPLETPTFTPKSERISYPTPTNVENPHLKQSHLQADPQIHPIFLFSPGDACVQTNILIQFCCRIKASKPAGVVWFKGDSLLQSNDHVRIFRCGEDYIFEIKKTRLDDSGSYSCAAYNHYGTQWSDFELTVKNKPPIVCSPKYLPKKRDKKKLKLELEKNEKNSPKTPEKSPNFVQRTWYERKAEMELRDGKTDADHINNLVNGNEAERVILRSTVENKIGRIAEREHSKWESECVEWRDNPYSKERISNRIKNNSWFNQNFNASNDNQVIDNSISNDNEATPDDQNEDFLGKVKKDLNVYKKDYYVKENMVPEVPSPVKNSDVNEESNHAIEDDQHSNTTKSNNVDMSVPVEDEVPEEDLIERHVKHLSKIARKDSKKEIEPALTTGIREQASRLPSVKNLVSIFSAKSMHDLDKVDKLTRSNSKANSIENLMDKVDQVDQRLDNDNNDDIAVKINEHANNDLPTFKRPHSKYEIHSLTARSIPREFRAISSQNIPRANNRIGRSVVNTFGNNIEDDVLISPSSDTPNASTCSPTSECYASDESNNSLSSSRQEQLNEREMLKLKCNSNGNSNGKNKPISRTILQRAAYWEKRCEEGLLSDDAVQQHFPN